MKTIICLTITFFCFNILFAQVPQGISYQAVVRDAQGNIVTNQQVQFRFTILQDAHNGTVVYQEIQSATTNSLGLVNLTIGYGTPYVGSLSSVDWANHPHFLRVEIDPQGGINFIEMGTTPLLSVPYAMHAQTAANAQTYTAGNGISISGGVITNTAPDQPITLIGQGATTVSGTYPNFIISSTDNNTTYSAGTGISITGNVITNTAPDQPITLIGQGATTVSGTYPNFIISSTDNNTTYSAGTGLNLTGTTFSHAPHGGDVSGTTNLTVTGIQGRPVSSVAPTNQQILQFNGTQWVPVQPSNIIQPGTGLTYTGNTLNSVWTQIGNNIYNNNTGRVGIGITSPTGKVTIQGDTSNVLFEVRDKDGKPVFVVYQDSVYVFVDATASKTNKGTFAVSSKAQTKNTRQYLRITPDSSRIYTENPNAGFGIRDLSGGSTTSYVQLTPDNYFIGHNAGISNTTGIYNSFIGYNAGKNNTSGISNIFLGYKAGFNNTTGSKNIAIGNFTGHNSNGYYNIFIGDSAGYNNTGYYNTFIGYHAGLNNTSNNQTFIGAGAGFLNQNGTDNTFLGASAGFYNKNGSYNTYLGTVAGINIESGSNNTFVGNEAGGGSFLTLGTGSNNVFVGSKSGYNIKNGTNNCFLGTSSGYNIVNGSGNIFIGYQAGYNETGSNKLYIENSNANSTNALIYGEFDNDILRFNGRVGIRTTPTYQLHVVASQATGAGTGLAHFVNNATSNDAAGVYGSCKNTDFYGYGGYFEGGYTGVYGKVAATGNNYYYGVYGQISGSGNGSYYGVYGNATGSSTKYGVFGIATGTGTNYGIYGSASGGTNNYAGYFQGNVHVNGTLSKSAGTFKIDHPLDPENKYLVHSFVESPEMKNIYDGIAILDSNGRAVVTLPSYFMALNKDFRYQLTCIGKFANVYIEKEIENNQFIIAGGIPGMKVSWQVTGIRKDPYALKYPIEPEVEKNEFEKGKYLNPEVYNQPKEKSINFVSKIDK